MSHPSTRTDYEKRLVSLQECVQALQKNDSPAGLGKIVLAFLKEWFSFEMVWLARYDAQAQVLEGIDGLLPREKDYPSLLALQPVLPGDLFDQVLLTGQIQTVVSLEKEPRAGVWQTTAQRQGIQGASVLPIRFRRTSFGVLVVGTRLWGGHRSEELTELKMLTGALGVALSGMGASLETPHSDSQTKVSALNVILSAQTFDERLQLVLEQSYQMTQPSRACFYWIDAEEQSCCLQEIYSGPPLRRTVSNRSAVAIKIPLQQINPFYQATLQNQVVAISDVESLIHSHNAPSRLMSLTQARAWLSVPLFDRQRLIGVLTVEESKPRVWSDQHKQYLVLMAQLMSHFETDSESAPLGSESQAHLPNLLNVLRETEPDAAHWERLLQQCLEQIGLQFALRWVTLLKYDADDQVFDSRSQYCAKKKQPFPIQLPGVSGVDTKLLSRLAEPLAVPSAEQDLRFVTWRGIFTELGVQSYILVKLGQQTGLGEFLLLGADLPRTWTEHECETIESIAQTIGKILDQQAQQIFAQQQQQLMELLTQGLSQLQQSRPSQLLETALDSIHPLLGTECTMILRWSPEKPDAKIALIVNNSSFEIDQSVQISVQGDHLLQTLLTTTTLKGKTAFPGVATLRGAVRDLASNSEWISGAGFIEILAVPIQISPELPSTGLVLAFNTSRKGWSALQREGLQILTRELASHASAHETFQHLTQRCETLECLNWYKQRQLEQLQQVWGSQSQALQELMGPEPVSMPLGTVSSIKSRPPSPLMQLKQSFTSLEAMLKTEVWELGLESEVISIATLLRRSLARIEPIVSARQLWTQVHNLTPSVSVKMPGQKLELMITELLLASCYRTKVGDRIDIWCRALQDSWVEVSITDHGRLNPHLVKDLTQYALTRTLTPILESAPGLHFKVCQSLVERLGGQLELTQLEDGRSLSRLILPTAV